MNSVFRVPLNVSAEQAEKLLVLQRGFANLCNEIALLVQSTRIWNRVALHHLAYRQLRARFPEMGAQMVCNAIYSVSRTCRAVFQNPQSPYVLAKLGDKPLPLLRFHETCPVYFDRHTLSLKDGMLSMFTLDGRMRFHLKLDAAVEANFHSKKLREMVLVRRSAGGYELVFSMMDKDPGANSADRALEPVLSSVPQGELPEYVVVEEVV